MSTFENLYEGFNELTTIPIIEKETNITAEQFYQEFISTRTPVLLNYLFSSSEWKIHQWNDPHYLRQQIPHHRNKHNKHNEEEEEEEEETLKIEYRQNISTESFGKGNEIHLSFHDFLTKIEGGEEHYYLTTQELEYDEEGHPYLFTNPLRYLVKDFPLQPKELFPTLIPFNINLWYGLTTTATTSGLHHDYHDNLYLLLQGEKEITLYSPAYAHQLYTVGLLEKIHPNGRINYEGEMTFADGRDLKAERAFQASLQLEELVVKRDGSHGNGHGKEKLKSSSSNVVTAEEGNHLNVTVNDSDDEIDAALDAVLAAEMDSIVGSDEDDEDNDGDDDENNDDGDEQDHDLLEDNVDVDFSDNDEDDEHEEIEQTRKRKPDQTLEQYKQKKSKKGPPNNFSQVNTSLTVKKLKKKFPHFLEAQKHSITITVKAGQMLYLPAGWFHEVRSKGNTGHMAMNYWFHPPDQKNNFQQPYQSNFWSKHWESRQKLPFRPIE